MSIAALARPTIARLTRSPRAWLTTGAWFVVGVTFALAARAAGSAHGADHVLVGVFGAAIVPLLAYATVGAALGRRSLAASGAPLVAFGAAPARVAAVSLSVAIVASALAGALTAVAIAMLAHGTGDPPLGRDAAASAYAGALGGAAYAAWFALGATFGKAGGGRFALLFVDWILDGMGGPFSIVCPRGHVRNLLGGAAPLDLPERASAIALVVLGLACAIAAVARAARTRR
jgi:hypothetical protein